MLRLRIIHHLRTAIFLLVLLMVLGALGTLIWANVTGMPKSWRQAVERAIAEHGIHLEIGHLSYHPLEGIVARNVKIYATAQRQQIISRLEGIILDLDNAKLAKGDIQLAKVKLDGARLVLPVDPNDPESEMLEINNLHGEFIPPGNPHIEVRNARGSIAGIEVVLNARIADDLSEHLSAPQPGNQDNQRELIAKMQERGIQPDTRTWAQLGRAYIANRDLPAARALLHQLRLDGIEVSPFLLVPMLNELAEARDLDGLAAEEKRIEPRLLTTAPVVGVLLKGYGNCRRTDLAEATVGRAPGCLEDARVLSALARVYALSKERPRDLERFSSPKSAESPVVVAANAWVGLALSFSGSEQEALRWMSGFKGSGVMFFHGVRCSVASRVGAAQLATALRQLFDDLNLTTEELFEAYLRLAITFIRAHREVSSELVAELNEAFVNQLRGSRSARAVLSDLIRAQTYPWLAMAIAFSNRFYSDFLELELLLDDESARKQAIQDLNFARTWSSSQANLC